MRAAVVFPRFKYQSGDPPIGPLQVAAVLRRIDGVELDWLDTTYEHDLDSLTERFAAKNYDLIGIYCMTSMFEDVRKIVSRAREVSRSSLVVLGGPHPTIMPGHSLSIAGVDGICTGEGEIAMVDLVDNDLDLRRTDGFAYLDGDGNVVFNDLPEPVQDLDSLPFPAYDLLHPRYFEDWFAMDFVRQGLRATNIIASRGCPYRCSYCQPTLSKMFGKKVRRMSTKRVVEMIDWLSERFDLNAFAFVDDTMVIDRKWVQRLSRDLIDKGNSLIFSCNTRADLVDRDLFSGLYEAGLRKVFLGIESGSQRVLDEVYQKGTTLDQVREAVDILKGLGLCVQGYFMLGAPGETEEEIRSTIDFAVSLDIDEATFSITTPLPGTYLYERTKDDLEGDITACDYYSKPLYRDGVTLPAGKLAYLKRLAFLKFYLSLKRIRWTLSSFLGPNGFRKNLLKLKRF